jgi:hypothetical protein
MGKIKEVFIEIMNNNRNIEDGIDLDYQYKQYLLEHEQYLLEQNKIKRDNLCNSLEQDVSDT